MKKKMGKYKKKSDEIKAAVRTKEIKAVIETVDSGSTLLNLVLGGGLAKGKIINIVGDNSTGKSLLASEAIATLRKQYGKKFRWRYDDAEAGYSFNSKELYGFEMLDESKEVSDTVEDFSNNVQNELDKIKKDELFVYVLDSLDSLTSEAEVKRGKERRKLAKEGKSPDVGSYDLERQKFLSQFFRQNSDKILKKNMILLIISQVRANIGVTFGNKYTRTGGKALDFYASQVIWLAEVEKLKKKKIPIGVNIKVKNTKNKIGKPFRTCYVNLLFDYGVDNIISNINYLFDLYTDMGKLKAKKDQVKNDDKKDKKIKPKFIWQGKGFSSVERLIKYIEGKNQEQELADAVIAKWKQLEADVAPNRKGKY